MEIKADNYYLDKENNLIYMIDQSQRTFESYPQCLWKFKCLSSDRTHHLDTESLKDILVKDLGPTIAPAMRLLYGAARV